MRQLTHTEIQEVSAGFKFHFNVIQAVFTVIGVSLINPIAGGVMIGGLIATQGVGNLTDMWIDEFGQVQGG